MADLFKSIPASVRNIAGKKQTQQTVHNTGKGFSEDTISPDLYKHRGKNADTLRWSMGREDNSADQFMEFWVNPSECTWKVATRTVIEKMMGGAVHHQAPLYTRFDMPVLSISFQSGNIRPNAYSEDSPFIAAAKGTWAEIPPGIGNFYRFLHLINEPNITTNTSNPNYINILYVSPLYKQKGLWLKGFFDENGVSWTDNAENPGMIMNWTANFVVFQSDPPLNKLRQTFQTLGIT